MPFIISRIIGLILIALAALGLSATPAPIEYTNPKTATEKFVATPPTTSAENIATSPLTVKEPKQEAVKETPKEKPVETKSSAPAATLPEIKVPDIPVPQISNDSSLTELNTVVRNSVVNVLCSITTGAQVESLTGSGVVIDSRGVILTNAHVAQYFLLRDAFGPNTLDCYIRTGSPAKPVYRAELLYLSSRWVAANKEELIKEKPMGTGENDYALLLITKKSDNSAFLGGLDALSPAVEDSGIDQTGIVSNILAGYPAGFLGALSISGNLDMVSSVSTIRQVFTFNETTVDLISLGGTIVAQRGASGGAVVSGATRKLVGLVVTTSDGDTTGERDLRAITLAHINRSIKSETGMSLDEYLRGDLSQRLRNFQNNIFPSLASSLKEVLLK